MHLDKEIGHLVYLLNHNLGQSRGVFVKQFCHLMYWFFY
jgi:hypothetical protein